MIASTEALMLPSAKLKEDEAAAADGLLVLIDDHVKKGMCRYGVDLETKMTNRNVIAEVNQRLRRAGWVTEWHPILEQHRLNAAVQNVTGYSLALYPKDEAYTEADRKTLM
jgi:hypothetical protein